MQIHVYMNVLPNVYVRKDDLGQAPVNDMMDIIYDNLWGVIFVPMLVQMKYVNKKKRFTTAIYTWISYYLSKSNLRKYFQMTRSDEHLFYFIY